MPNAEVLAGRNLLTERPVPDKQFRSLQNMSGDLASKPVFVALAYDTRHTDIDGSPLLILADDANRRIIYCNSTTLAIVGSTFEYPIQLNTSLTAFGDRPVKQCYGLAILNEPDDCLLAFLSEEQGLDSGGKNARYPILYYLRYDPAVTTPNNGPLPVTMTSTRLKIEKWAVVDAGKYTAPAPGSNSGSSGSGSSGSGSSGSGSSGSGGYSSFTLISNDPSLASSSGVAGSSTSFGRGMSEYHNDLLVVGRWRENQTIMTMDYYGQPLAYHPGIQSKDAICGVQYINGRTYTTMDKTPDPDIGGRILAKYLTEQMDASRMVPLMSIEPFFLGPREMEVPKDDDTSALRKGWFGPDITIFQDRMAACYLDNVYTYRMAYIAFIVNGMPNDDIDLGSVLIGDYKIQKVVLKNIADVYKMRSITLSVDDSQISGVTKPKLKEAALWVFLSATDPVVANDTTDIVKDLAMVNASSAVRSESKWAGTGSLSSTSIWSQQIQLAEQPPYVEPDGEVAFWVAVGVPTSYDDGAAVGVDDSPFVVPLLVSAKLG